MLKITLTIVFVVCATHAFVLNDKEKDAISDLVVSEELTAFMSCVKAKQYVKRRC
jgi:hypothetical protein